MTKAQLKKLKEKLLQRRQALLTATEGREGEGRPAEAGDEADAAADTQEKEMLFKLTDMERQVMDDIQASLTKMERGSYGTCEHCGKPIAFVRLRAMPFTRYCIKCQSTAELPQQ